MTENIYYNNYKKDCQFCQYIYSDGNLCNVHNCKNRTHKKYIINSIMKELSSINLIGKRRPCSYFVKQDLYKKSYKKCNRFNCKFHYIISDILDLPNFFYKIEKLIDIKIINLRLIDIYEDFYNKKLINNGTNNNKIIIFLNNLISYFDYFKWYEQQLLLIYLFHLLDTPYGKIFINKHKKFKECILYKIQFLSNNISRNNSCEFNRFSLYIKKTFTYDTSKKYLTKSKNIKYNIFLFKLCVKLIIIYKKHILKSYAPGGELYNQTKRNFFNLRNLQQNNFDI